MPDEAEHPDVIVLPGYMGTTLRDPSVDEELWGGLVMLWTDLDRLLVGDQGGEMNHLVPEHPLWPVYPILIRHLRQSGRRVHFFAYDWRRSIRRLAEKFDNFVSERVGGRRFDIVAHSMGGLIAALWHARFGEGKIRRIVCIGVPFGGAEVALSVLLEGAPHIANFNLNATPQQILRVARRMPSLYELIPPLPGAYDPGRWPSGISRDLLSSAEKTRGMIDEACMMLTSLGKRCLVVVGAGEHMPAWRTSGDGFEKINGTGDGVILENRALLPGVAMHAFYRSFLDSLELKLHLPLTLVLGGHPLLPVFARVRSAAEAFLNEEPVTTLAPLKH